MEFAYPDTRSRPKGIGGWLLLPLMNLLGNTVWLTYSLLSGATGSPLPHSGYAGEVAVRALAPWLVQGYMIFNGVFDVFGVVCLVYFLRRKAALPRMMMVFYLLVLVHAFSSAALAYSTHQYPDHLILLIAAVIACGVWIPYFRISERVKATFVK